VAQRGDHFADPSACERFGAFCRKRWTILRGILIVGSLLTIHGSAQALIVGSNPVFAPDTSVNPAEYGPAWTKGDPGFDNVALSGGYIYLGDGWILSARHVGYNPASGITFQTASGPVTYHMAGARVANNGTLIPGPYYTDYGFAWSTGHMFAVSNPSSITQESGQPFALSPYTDLQLFRINGDPGLPELTIASQPMPNNFTAGTAPEVMLIGNSSGRAQDETHWNVTGTSPNVVWTTTTGTGDRQGYVSNGVAAKRWGTNRLSDPASFPSPSPFSAVVSNTTGVLPLATGVGAISRDIIVNTSQFDPSSQTGATPFESQAIGGDSGAAVFHKRNGNQWELSGIVNARLTFEGQPSPTAVYGNATLFADLSYYNQDYLHSIKDIIESHPDYSIVGDVNLDGILSGDGTGPTATDDIAAFIQGWKFNNGTALGNIASWKKGDLNRDGQTNVSDFILLRNAFNGAISPAVASLLQGAVPEPSAATLILLAAWLVVGAGRRRRHG
jgi:hypothetical protein